jgi:hypothetical protein
MSGDEIAMLRTFRQVTDEARVQILGFMDFMYATKRRD